jgi:hypothetical protein
MEATHFIEVWKYSDGDYDSTFEPWPIEDLQFDLKDTIQQGHETIAVWRIKPTDVPLQTRLLKLVLRETEYLQKKNYAY